MPSILTAEYVPIDEIVPPVETALVRLRGTVTDISILRGGFVYARAFFGITDNPDRIVTNRHASTVLAQPLSRELTISRFTSDGNTLIGNLTVEAALLYHGLGEIGGEYSAPAWLEEIAGKMACVSAQLEQGLPLFTTTYLIRDNEAIPDFNLRHSFQDA